MKRINWYILRNNVAPFMFGTLTVVFLFFMQFVMKNLPQLVGKGLDNSVIIQLIIYNIAWMAILAIPMGVLFASLISFGNMSASSEITILKASGASLYRLMLPLLITGGILSYLLFLYNSEIVPDTNHKANLLLYDISRKKPTFNIEAGKFSTDIDGFTILSKNIDTSKNTLYNVTIYDNSNYRIMRTINAEQCDINWSNNMQNLIFILSNGEMIETQRNKITNVRLLQFKTYTIKTKTHGFDFQQSEAGTISRGDREMNIADMQKVVNDAKKSINTEREKQQQIINNEVNYLLNGTKSEFKHTKARFLSLNNNIDNHIKRVDKYEVEIHKKYAIPFACFIFVLIGCPLGIITKGGNFGISAAITLIFYVIYWSMLIVGEKLADRAIIAPVLSMWLGNIVIGVAGIILTLKVNKY